jgi:predicted Rossmann fold nucleotide-binding protein DprA/Smf involved in DNA uptake
VYTFIMKIAVVGSRKFSDYKMMEEFLDELPHPITLIVSGGARGADVLAERYAEKHNIPTKIFLPDWSIGKAAGPIRNALIVAECDVLVCFWDGESRGSKNSHDLALKQNKIVYLIRY